MRVDGWGLGVGQAGRESERASERGRGGRETTGYEPEVVVVVWYAGRMAMTEAELNLIFNKYKKNGAFNYYVRPVEG